MSLPTPDEYWLNDRKAEILGENIAGNRIEYATVTRLSAGRPVLLFLGSQSESPMFYHVFKSYSPAAGDRVLLINGIIIGGWRS